MDKRRLLIINPNTRADMTALVGDAARIALPGVAINLASARFGGRYIASRAAFAIAAHAALDAFAEHGAGADAVLLACYGDPGLDALREIAGVPVIGLIEAAAEEATATGGRFAVVTGGSRWAPMLREFHLARGLDTRLAAVRTVAPTGGEIASDPEGALAQLAAACRTCAAEDGAGAVILGGVGLIGLAARLQPEVPVPVICSVEAGFRAAARALTQPPVTPAFTPDGVESLGLSPALARYL
jgi:allantoin racemase